MEERGQMAEALSPKLLRAGIERAIARFNLGEGLALNAQERAILADDVQDEIAGLGPLEPLLRDPEIDDVIVHGATRGYVERVGRLYLSPVRFAAAAPLMKVHTRRATGGGREYR